MDMNLGDTRLIVETCERHSLSKDQTAYVLATAFWETARTMKPVVEAFWKSDAWRKANLRYYPWHGRGFVQLTWERNYQRAARELGVPVDKDPDLMLDPKVSADVLVIGMKRGWFTGRALSDYISGDRADFINARRVVNSTDKAREIAALAEKYVVALDAASPTPAPKPKRGGLLAAILAFIKAIFGGRNGPRDSVGKGVSDPDR